MDEMEKLVIYWLGWSGCFLDTLHWSWLEYLV